MIASLKLVLLHKIAQKMTNPSKKSNISTYFPSDRLFSDLDVTTGREEGQGAG